jgi:hypothetical protein
MQKPVTLKQVCDEIVADLEANLETESDICRNIDRVREIVAKWEQHITPGSEWHLQECCVDELVAELKAALR